MSTQNLDSTDIPTPICSLCGTRRPDEYIQSGEYVEDGMTFPIFSCVECKREVEFD